MLRFIPHANASVPSNPLTGGRRSHVSTVAPLNYTKAAAIAATQRFDATKWHTLLEGLGYIHESSTDSWTHERAVMEGFNPFDRKTRNGAKYTFTSQWSGPTDHSDALGIIVDTHRSRLNIHDRADISRNSRAMLFNKVFCTNELGFGTDRNNSARGVARYESISRPFFYRWQTDQDSAFRHLSYATAGTELLWKPDHPYPDVWHFTEHDITERVWWHTLGQGHHHDRNSLTIGERHTVGTTVHTTTGATYYLADDGKTTQLDGQTTVTGCETDFHTRHPEYSA